MASLLAHVCPRPPLLIAGEVAILVLIELIEELVTIMFADIRGFTPMAERMPPQDMVTMLNEFFEVLEVHQGSPIS